ncbi:MAG: hypothetical protein V1863_03640, partial [Candidatus Omnitrophota bacterium]
ILRAETNIPDFTARLQELISTKVQEVFGIDEPISVKLHIAKIISSEDKCRKKQNTQTHTTEEVHLPYH